MGLQGCLERRALHPAKRLLPEHLEDLAQLHTALPLDLAIELDERDIDLGAQELADGRLAAAAQADQGDALLPGFARRAAELRQKELTRVNELGGRQPVDELREQLALDWPIRPFIEQLGKRHAHRAGDAAQQHDRAIALAGFELGEIALGHLGMAGQDLARHAAAAAHGAHPLAEPPQEGVEVGRGLGLGSLARTLRHGIPFGCIIMHERWRRHRRDAPDTDMAAKR